MGTVSVPSVPEGTMGTMSVPSVPEGTMGTVSVPSVPTDRQIEEEDFLIL
jgi:hypothetical protein